MTPQEKTEEREVVENFFTRKFHSKHAILDYFGTVVDHHTKPSAAKRRETSRRKEKARRQARRANR